jgi:hypothetical protein
MLAVLYDDVINDTNGKSSATTPETVTSACRVNPVTDDVVNDDVPTLAVPFSLDAMVTLFIVAVGVKIAKDEVETVITAVPPLVMFMTSAPLKNMPVLASPVGAMLGVAALPAIVTNCPDMLVLPSWVILANIPSSILFRFVALIAGALPLTHVVLLYCGIFSTPLYSVGSYNL